MIRQVVSQIFKGRSKKEKPSFIELAEVKKAVLDKMETLPAVFRAWDLRRMGYKCKWRTLQYLRQRCGLPFVGEAQQLRYYRYDLRAWLRRASADDLKRFKKGFGI